jgi:hypothetical protein
VKIQASIKRILGVKGGGGWWGKEFELEKAKLATDYK